MKWNFYSSVDLALLHVFNSLMWDTSSTVDGTAGTSSRGGQAIASAFVVLDILCSFDSCEVNRLLAAIVVSLFIERAIQIWGISLSLIICLLFQRKQRVWIWRSLCIKLTVGQRWKFFPKNKTKQKNQGNQMRAEVKDGDSCFSSSSRKFWACLLSIYGIWLLP